ncbi:hypothetical protein TruAng_000655 [Truncatella angustata]|nr:hypothetical protein TruAng_000655 [Truncatella angustata]
MNGSDNKAPIERRASMRTSMRLSVAPGEDDDYNLAMMGISDGFRPADVTQHQLPSPPIPSQQTPATQVQPPRPSSIAKPPQPRESFSLRHDGGMGPLADPVVADSSSNAGPSSLGRSESPYQGPSGPSFPYQMYTQNVRPARTVSLATTATVPASEQSYDGPNNPTHPYQMYPQNTVSPVDAEERPTNAAIPLGFIGTTTDTYQRRIGTEGEEAADMIGPDGHTEQLPPYTRYPDEAYQRKIAGIGGLSTIEGSEASSSTASVPSQTQMQAIPGAGGIGLATRNPEFASSEDLRLDGANSPQSRQSVRSFNSDGGSHHEVNTAAMTVIDEKKPLKKWQVAAKRKVWGVVPCWALTLTILIIVMLAVVLGTVLGIFFNKPKKQEPSNHGGSSATMTYDAQPLATVPAGLAPLPEGPYALPLMLTRSPTTCFNDSTQAQAWNCNQVFSQMAMVINKRSDTASTSQYTMSITNNDSFTIQGNQYSYGMQPPSVDDIQMLLVTDVNEPSRGPAWAFELAYNKTVIIPESLFPTPTSSTSNAKRSHFPPPPPGGGGGGGGGGGNGGGFGGGGDGFKRKGLAQSGDKPWICQWGGTVLEVFVYPNQNNSQPTVVYTGSSASSTNSDTVNAASAAVTSTSTSTQTSTQTSDVTSSTTSTSVSGEWAFTDYRNGYVTTRYHKDDKRQATSTATTSTSATQTVSSGVFDTSKPAPSDFQFTFFPRVVKMEERRLAGDPSVQPYCRQYQINGNGSPATPIKDSSGNYIEIKIVELEPSGESEHERKNHRKQRQVHRRVIDDYLNHGLTSRDSDSDMSDCGCMWWTT